MFRPRHRYLFIFLFCTIPTSLVLAQDLIRFQNIAVNDGLSMGTITAVVREPEGFVWLATAEGLHRYDGKDFKIFKHIDGADNSLSDSYIKTMCLLDGKLFLGNHSGLIDEFDLQSHEVKTLNPSLIDRSFDYPISCLEVVGNNLLIGTEGGGLWVYEPLTSNLSIHPMQLELNPIITDIVVKGDQYYVSSLNSIFRCSYTEVEELIQLDYASISAFDFLADSLIIGTNRGLFAALPYSDLIEKELPPRKRRVKNVTDLWVEKDELWVGTEGGLVRYNQDGRSHYVHNDIRPFSLVNNQINSLYVDDEGIVWIGTIAGLSRYSPAIRKFGLLQYFDFKGESFNNNVYYIYTAKDGTIWLGTLSGGLVQLNKNHDIIAVYPMIKDGASETRSVRCIYEDSKGNFWIGTRDEGLFLFNRSSNSFTHVGGKEGHKLSNNVVRAIYEDSKGRLWVGTQNGLNRYVIEEDAFYHFQAEPSSRTNNSIYQITEDPKTGQLLLASFRGGLQLFNPRSNHFVSLKYHSDDSNSLSNDNLMCMAWLNQDSLLIGTYGGGLNVLDLRTKKCKHITEKNGLINNSVYGVLYEGKGLIWLSTNKGVVRYDLYGHRFTNFHPIHYLQNSEFNEGAFSTGANGYFYFGGVSGFNYFQPKTFSYDSIAPKVVLTGINGEYERLDEHRIELNYLNSRLELGFRALYYINPEGVKYKYKLLGYDQSWVEVSKENLAIYPRLSPGRYSFQVVASDEFGQWEAEPILLQVIVRPPFWQRWWFIVLMVFLVGGALYGLFRFRTREIERTYKLQLVDSELRALRSQMNPHFIFNSLNSIQYFILKKQPQEAYTYLSKFASLMRKILQNSRLKYISIADETEWLGLYLEMEKLRMDDELHFEIDHTEVDDIEHSYIPTMLIQPYVENSIIHGLLPKEGDRRISIRFEKKADHVECVVEDNGIGRLASKEMNERRTSKHASAGMELTKSRLRILSEGQGDFDVKVEDLRIGGKASGTRVTIKIPLISV